MVRAPQADGAAGHAAPRALRPRLGARLRARAWSRRRSPDRVGELVASDASTAAVGAGPAAPRRPRRTCACVRSALPEVPLDGPVDLLRRRGVPLLRPRPARRARRALVGVRAGRPGGLPALGAPPARRAPRRPGDARPDLPRQLSGATPTRWSATPTRTSCSTSTRCPDEPSRPARRAEQVRSSTEAMRDAVRRLAAAAARRVGRAVPGVRRRARWSSAASTWRSPGWSRGTPTRMRILDQAGRRARARACTASGPRAPPAPASRAARSGTGWRLTGESRFSSGIDVIDRALVPGWVDDGTHLLLDVDATAVRARPRRRGTPRRWTRRARSPCSVDLTVAGRRRGRAGRASTSGGRGFPVGGLGVAAVWAGGAAVGARAGRRRPAPVPPTAHQPAGSA